MPRAFPGIATLCACCLMLCACAEGTAEPSRSSASSATQSTNEQVLQDLPFESTEDFELASRGLVARADSLIVEDASGNVVWDMDQWAFLQGEAPGSVNPSLWRQARLNAQHGLYRVADRIYQVRGYDLSNLSIIEGDTGYIVVDPLITREVAAAAMQFAFEHLPQKPIVAVIYSHSHADHFGGVKGVIEEESVTRGETRIVAPEGFMDYAVSENVLAGNAMARRASYMFGSLLEKDELGGVGSGLGKAISTGEITLIEPTDIITETGEVHVIDGVRFVFMNTPYAEAPAELMFYLPDMKAFYSAEEANGTLHNLYTLRGAQVRDALLWSEYLDEAIDLIGVETEVLFGGHHWPRWGYDDIVDYLGKQRDAYRYIHDQTLRLANHGLTMLEIAEQIELPESTAHEWYNRGYYGSVNHNSKAVYQKYLGFFDGNPATLNPLTPVDSGRKYVEFMGGADALLSKAREAYDNHEYRWVAQVVNHLVFAEPDNLEARSLQADAMEQLGYRAESGPWRNFYLSGAGELRNGVSDTRSTVTASRDMINALTTDMFFDYMAVRLNGPKAAELGLRLNFVMFDSGEQHLVDVSNGVLHHKAGRFDESADATIETNRGGLLALTMAGVPLDVLTATGAISIEGDSKSLEDLLAVLDNFEFWFNIVTP